jgi:hypothetical protein
MDMSGSKYFIIISIIFIFLFLLTSLSWNNLSTQATKVDVGNIDAPTYADSAYIEIKDKRLLIEVADTVEERTRGLSGREYLPQDSGMLFVFSEPNIPGFWMKDMNISLDMIWIDGNLVVKDITRNAVPDSYPIVFTPHTKILYVLEVNAGVAENIKVGDKVSIQFQEES